MAATPEQSGATVKPGATAAQAAGRTRLSPEKRKAQLTEIGLELLATRPIHEVALDEVADRAGISRTLLFHYFPTKSDFYAAVVERAGQRLLGARRGGGAGTTGGVAGTAGGIVPAGSTGPAGSTASAGAVSGGELQGEPSDSLPRVRARIDGYLRLVDSSRDIYVRLVRGAAGGDPAVMARIDDLRTALIPMWVEVVGLPAEAAEDPVTQLLVRGWLVGLEEVALTWSPTQVARSELTEALARSFLALMRANSPAGRDSAASTADRPAQHTSNSLDAGHPDAESATLR